MLSIPQINYIVVMKVHRDGIQIRTDDSLNLLCHDLDSNRSVQVFLLNGSSRGAFHQQSPQGQLIETIAFFTTSPIHISTKASYAFEILTTIDSQKIGAAYLYLDPKFSSQGIQRMHIIGTPDLTPIGQLQVEYLIIKNPVAYGVKVQRPGWLSQVAQLDAGHRGAGKGCRDDLPGFITENTLASFNYAARHGADMCELDILCTKDGIPIVYHNFLLEVKGKGKMQVDEFTLDELRALQASIHDDNCRHNDNGKSEIQQQCSQLFPTLEEVFQGVDQTCGLNIELKWPQLLPNGENEAVFHREINDFVDRVVDCIFKHSNGRHILLSTLNADIAIMLRLKQSEYPVLFLTTGNSERFKDPVTKTVENAIHFAEAFDLAGINPNVAFLTEDLVRHARDSGLLVYAWGEIRSAHAIKELKRTGLDGVIYDRIDLIKPED